MSLKYFTAYDRYTVCSAKAVACFTAARKWEEESEAVCGEKKNLQVPVTLHA